jgi:hypothetical protein
VPDPLCAKGNLCRGQVHADCAILQVELDRYDLFHAHFFLSHEGTMGLLFHAKEYPAQCKEFPYFLGFCQENSNLTYSEDGMAWRNYLWFKV